MDADIDRTGGVERAEHAGNGGNPDSSDVHGVHGFYTAVAAILTWGRQGRSWGQTAGSGSNKFECEGERLFVSARLKELTSRLGEANRRTADAVLPGEQPGVHGEVEVE